MSAWSGDLLAPAQPRLLRRRWQPRAALAAVAAPLAERLGRQIARGRRYSPAIPGLTGAVLLCLAIGEITGHVFGHGLAPWVTMLAAAVFLLRIDGRIHLLRTPRAGNERGG